MAWIHKNTFPTIKGIYKVKVQMCDIPSIIEEHEDYFDGFDWDFYGFRQFINEWWQEDDIDKILFEAERRRKMFHWFIDGLGSFNYTPENKPIWVSRHGIGWMSYDRLTPDWITEEYNINI